MSHEPCSSYIVLYEQLRCKIDCKVRSPIDINRNNKVLAYIHIEPVRSNPLKYLRYTPDFLADKADQVVLPQPQHPSSLGFHKSAKPSRDWQPSARSETPTNSRGRTCSCNRSGQVYTELPNLFQRRSPSSC